MSVGGTYASPPCMAGEVDPGYFDPAAVDPVQARDAARWRRAERVRLIALRQGLGQAGRARISERIGLHLAGLLAERGVGHGVGRGDGRGIGPGIVLSGYWPIRGEPDLRPLLAGLHRAGVTIALPVVAIRAAPLVFRRWTPKTRMLRGEWNIPVPPPEAEALTPDIALAPCLGWTQDGYRLGWGGGYFDRTLAALSPRPCTIGIGLCAARLATIYPQPHDVPLDMIVTEDGPGPTRKSTP